MKNNICLYAHNGSKNHGCEALVRSIDGIIKKDKTILTLFSSNPEEDEKYNVNDNIVCRPSRHRYQKYSLYNILLHVIVKFFKDNCLYSFFLFNKMFSHKFDYRLALSIGGDNYCYGNPYWLAYLNKRINKYGTKTVLFGCSIESGIINQQKVKDDLNSYSLITARESITYNALLNAGLNIRIKLYPDSAFTLEQIQLELPDGFIAGNTVGLNISPLIMNYEKENGTTFKNCINLIDYIIKNTNMNVALIPHVVWENNNDLQPLTKLYERFKDSGRVVLIGDHNCMELKGYISRCRFFIGARTHATIAAYSTCVPTVVIGYSVKSKGIAEDIFGTYKNYVVPVQELAKENQLVEAFKWLESNEQGIKNRLGKVMPAYRAKAREAGNEILKLIEE